MPDISKILVVEDEYIVALDLKSQIEKLGHAVVGIAGTGQQAIELADEHRPDLILMDIRLRGDLDGIDAAIKIREHLGIPIIYLTAFTDATTLERASITQPFGYILKPYQERELETTIQMAIYKSQIEAELHRSVNQLNLIMKHTTDGLVLVDSGMNILRVNQQAEAYLTSLGHDLDMPLTTIGNQSLDTLLPEVANSNRLEVDVSYPYEQVFEISLSEEFESESKYFTELSSNRARLVIIRDITMQRQIQKHSEENARMAAIGQLAAGISHDFNNILGTILTKVDLLKMTQPDLKDRSLNHLEGIRYHVKRASDLISQLLDFSRGSQLEIGTLNLYPLINELMKLVKRTFPESIVVNFRGNNSDYWIHGDPTRISQAIMNLLLRSKDAMVDGGNLQLSLDVCEFSDLPESLEINMVSDHWVRIALCDDGVPIPTELLPKIFEPFISPEYSQQGLTIRLAQVKSIIDQHNGYIVVESTAEGTCFEVFLPAFTKELEQVPEQEPQALSQQMNGQPTVLYAEDDAELRSTMSEMLELLGYNIFVAPDGREALATFNEHEQEIDLVLTDMIMPHMDGLELSREIREKSSTVKLVIISGYTSHSVDEINEIGVDKFMTKPLDIDTLQKTLVELLGK